MPGYRAVTAFPVPGKLHGRDAASDALHAAYERVRAQGVPGTVTIGREGGTTFTIDFDAKGRSRTGSGA
ncbi:MAG TPA: hypothetical protein VKE22_30270 [Haliangiales bacterium]|nr:hypothetical protein [Haliangiales bacterium]